LGENGTNTNPSEKCTSKKKREGDYLKGGEEGKEKEPEPKKRSEEETIKIGRDIS